MNTYIEIRIFGTTAVWAAYRLTAYYPTYTVRVTDCMYNSVRVPICALILGTRSEFKNYSVRVSALPKPYN